MIGTNLPFIGSSFIYRIYRFIDCHCYMTVFLQEINHSFFFCRLAGFLRAECITIFFHNEDCLKGSVWWWVSSWQKGTPRKNTSLLGSQSSSAAEMCYWVCNTSCDLRIFKRENIKFLSNIMKPPCQKSSGNAVQHLLSSLVMNLPDKEGFLNLENYPSRSCFKLT